MVLEDKFSVIEETEKIYRKLAHEVYTKTHGKIWWKRIPGKANPSAIKSKIDEWKKKDPLKIAEKLISQSDLRKTSIEVKQKILKCKERALGLP